MSKKINLERFKSHLKPSLTASRRRIVRHLFHPLQFKDSIALTKSSRPSFSNSALAGSQAALTAAIALPIFYLSPFSHLVGFAALGTLVALFGRFAPPQERMRILFESGICQLSSVLVMSWLAFMGAPLFVQFIFLALACGIYHFLAISRNFGAPGPLIFVFAAGASIATELKAQEVLERVTATSVVIIFALLICYATEKLRQLSDVQTAINTRKSNRKLLIASTRSTIGAGIALFVSHLCGAEHPEWAAMGALAVMQGTHLHISMNRAIQRMAGTVVGGCVAWLFLVQAPNPFTVIIAIIALQIITEIVIGINYAFGQIFVTPMALLITFLAAPGMHGAEMVPERIVDTFFGTIIGVLIAILLSTIDDRKYLEAHHTKRLDLNTKDR